VSGATSRILFPVEGGRVKGEGSERGGGERETGVKEGGFPLFLTWFRLV
jgi:hypothetical protein